MNIKPLISVITVCRNNAATLERTLHSVMSQDWPFIEHIVVDGASTDGSVAILKSFPQGQPYFISEPDNGIYDAMNKGLTRANGEIICFLNADDQYANSYVLTEVATQMHKFNLDALIADVSFFRKENPLIPVRRYRSDRFNPNRLSFGWMPAHPALFLSRGIVNRVGYYKTNYHIAGDFEYIVRAFHFNKLRYQYLSKVMVRMQLGGISTKGWRSTILLNREMLRACQENGLQTNLFKILLRYPVKFLEFFHR